MQIRTLWLFSRGSHRIFSLLHDRVSLRLLSLLHDRVSLRLLSLALSRSPSPSTLRRPRPRAVNSSPPSSPTPTSSRRRLSDVHVLRAVDSPRSRVVLATPLTSIAPSISITPTMSAISAAVKKSSSSSQQTTMGGNKIVLTTDNKVITMEERVMFYDSLTIFTPHSWQQQRDAFAIHLPVVLKLMGANITGNPFQIIDYHDSPKQEGGTNDCGVIALKVIECLLCGKDMAAIKKENAKLYRRDIARTILNACSS